LYKVLTKHIAPVIVAELQVSIIVVLSVAVLLIHRRKSNEINVWKRLYNIESDRLELPLNRVRGKRLSQPRRREKRKRRNSVAPNVPRSANRRKKIQGNRESKRGNRGG